MISAMVFPPTVMSTLVISPVPFDNSLPNTLHINELFDIPIRSCDRYVAPKIFIHWYLEIRVMEISFHNEKL